MLFKNFKTTRSTRFLLLLMLSIVIGLANAAIFYSLAFSSTVSITNPTVIFVQGEDGSGVVSIGSNSSTASLTLAAYPNITLTYEQPLNISNTDAASHDFRFRHLTISPANGTADVGNFSYICFTILDASGISQATFNYTTSGNDWITPATMDPYETLPANTQWVVYIETMAAASAQDVSASITIAVDVQ